MLRLRDELDREREERNYFQLERDKINTFWEITKKQLEEARANQRNKDREMEEAEERHAVEIKVYKQKVKHLLYEHQNQIAELKMDGMLICCLSRRAPDSGSCLGWRAFCAAAGTFALPHRRAERRRLSWPSCTFSTAAMNRKVAQDEFHEEGSTLRRDARSLKVRLAAPARVTTPGPRPDV